MNKSPGTRGNIFNCMDLVKVIESIKRAATVGYWSKELENVLADTFGILKKVTRSSGIHFYSVDEDMDAITLEYDGEWKSSGGTWPRKLSEVSILLANAVQELKSCPKSEETSRNAIRVFEEERTVCFPIIAVDGRTFTLLELIKGYEDEPFSKNDKKIVGTVVKWIGKNLCSSLLKRRSGEGENDFSTERTNMLLNVHNTFLDFCLCSMIDHGSKANLIVEFMGKMNEFIGAERAKVFLFDEEEDLKWPPEKCDCYESSTNSQKGTLRRTKKIIEFTRDSDIAWHTVNDKSVINISDIASDTRLNTTLDRTYGFTVKNLLSFPIHGKNKVIGAANIMNNLKKPYFTKDDEEVCILIAEYLAFILNGIGLSAKKFQSELQFEMAQDMFSYRTEPSPENIKMLVNTDLLQSLPEGFLNFSWYPAGYEDQLDQLAYFMMKDIIDDGFCPEELLAKFILFTKNLYNPSCFHNFEHAVNVLHCIYIIFKRNMEVFNNFEITALAVTALCHDAGRSGLRRRGVSPSDNYHDKLYDIVNGYTSMSERTVGIIKATGLFENYSSMEYQELMNLVMICARGINLAVSFERKLKVVELMDKNEFDLEEPAHRSDFITLVMSAADLSGQTKPIDVAMMLTRKAYEEFYEKGDYEKEIGQCPTEKTNRDFCDKIVEQHLLYLTKIVKPAYEIIGTLLPNTKSLLRGIEAVIEAETTNFEELISYQSEARVI